MTAAYKSPGVYVEEKSSGLAPIVGVGTSTAGFIGLINPAKLPSRVIDAQVKLIKSGESNVFKLELPSDIGRYDVLEAIVPSNANFEYTETNILSSFEVSVTGRIPSVQFSEGVSKGARITGSYTLKVIPALINQNDPSKLEEASSSPIFDTVQISFVNNTQNATEFELSASPNAKDQDTVAYDSDCAANFKVESVKSFSSNDFTIGTNEDGKPIVTFTNDAFRNIPDGTVIGGSYSLRVTSTQSCYQLGMPPDAERNFKDSVPMGEVKLCTNFSEFKKWFGDFSEEHPEGHSTLAHAVFGFFRNGGTRCFVVWVNNEESQIKAALEKFEAIDEIALVAAPGVTGKTALTSIINHCETTMGDRFAILDGPEKANEEDLTPSNDANAKVPDYSNYAALYYPWIKVFNPLADAQNPETQTVAVPPSGYIAGLYARVDAQRGVFKAPANEVLLGAVGLTDDITKNQQGTLNEKGVNCIRYLNGNIRVWGARTFGGDKNGEFKYINVRRLLIYLRESIDANMQWTVFEPNTPELWAKIRRNVTAFLLMEWRAGALFGTTPEQAFYVKCDEETNPPEVRDLGRVVTEIGVAVVRPAEFVIFRISQWPGPGGS